MSLSRTDGPTEEEWAHHREHLIQLYAKENKPLHRVMSEMENNYGFVAKKNQYEKFLHTKWRVHKKIKSQTWEAIAPIVDDLQRRGRSFELWIDNERKSIQTIRKEIRRYIRPSDAIRHANLDKLPKGVIIRELNSRRDARTVSDLPFFYFEQYFDANLPIIKAQHKSKLSSLTQIFKNALKNHLTLDETSCQALQIASLDRNDVSVFPKGIQMNNTPYSLPVQCSHVVIEGIRREITEISLAMNSRTAQFFSLRATVKSLYQHSLKSGDVSAVQFLLSQSIPDINPNSILKIEPYGTTTPLQVAINVENYGLVKVLLRHGADIQPKLPENSSYLSWSPLDQLILKYCEQRTHTAELGLDFFRILFENGAELQVDAFKRLIKNDRVGRLVSLVISRDAASKHQIWTDKKVFAYVFRFQTSEVVADTLEVMFRYNVDLKRHCPISHGDCCDRVYSHYADIVIDRGDLSILKLMVVRGARMSRTALTRAIDSGNESLIQWILAQDLTSYHAKPDWTKALSAAIYTKNVQLIELIASRAPTEATFSDAALITASNMDNWDLFMRLYRMRLEQPPNRSLKQREEWIKVLNHALSCCIKDGQDQIALELLDAMVDLVIEFDKKTYITCSSGESSDRQNFWHRCLGYDFDETSFASACGPRKIRVYPLDEALKARNAAIFDAILEADMDLHLGLISINLLSSSSLEYAVEWGNLTVLQRMLDIHARHFNELHKEDHKAINTAITMKDMRIFDMLVDAGLPINWYSTIFDKNTFTTRLKTPLTTAVLSKDLNVVAHVLQMGADPHDSDALTEAFFHRRKGWGGRILMDTIERGDLEQFKEMILVGADANEIVDASILTTTQPSNGLEDSLHPECFISPFGYSILEARAIGIDFVDHLLQISPKTLCKPETLVCDDRLGCLYKTAFLSAIETANIPVIELLMRHNADINFPAKRKIKRTPLQHAVEKGNLEVVRLLLERGANVNGPAAMRGGGTALQLAAIQGYIRIILLLLENGADVHAPASRSHGRTALEGAAEHGRLDTVALLLQHYGQYETKHEKEFTSAIAYAEENGFDPVADFLRKHKATDASEFDEFLNFDTSEGE